jgi:23S rRNA (uracil1939-C5)-methyltransferase
VSVSEADRLSESAPGPQRGDVVTVRCERMVHGGLCLARVDGGLTLFVENAIPGELVEARLRYRARGSWFAEIANVLEPSQDRISAPCPYVPDCGGCQLQHVAYKRQLDLKREVLADAMRRQGIAVPTDVGMHGMEHPWRYRHRGEFHVVAGERGVEDAGLGFNRARSWRPIAVDDCLIHHRHITDALPMLREVVHRGGTPGLHTLHLTAGEDGELLVRGNPRNALRIDAIQAAASAPGSGLLSTEWTTLRWRGRTYRVRADTFIQVNWEQMDVLYGRVVAGLKGYAGRRVVDAYAGIGILACYLAGDAAEVVCIENNRAAARTGLLNARVNDVAERVRYIPSAVEDALPGLASEGAFDMLVLDPPRAGCDGRVTAWLALAGPPRVVYVSCDPATLARDLHVLVASGPYEIEALDIVDMFPQTYHVESVVVMNRRPL